MTHSFYSRLSSNKHSQIINRNDQVHLIPHLLVKILYSSMFLLLWVCGLYLCCSADQEDNNLKIHLMIISIPLMIITSSPSPSSSTGVDTSPLFLMLAVHSKCGEETEEENIDDPTYTLFYDSEEEKKEES